VRTNWPSAKTGFDWLATNTDDISTQSHLLVRAKKIAKWKTLGFNLVQSSEMGISIIQLYTGAKLAITKYEKLRLSGHTKNIEQNCYRDIYGYKYNARIMLI
jgi:hypothetical protein